MPCASAGTAARILVALCAALPASMQVPAGARVIGSDDRVPLASHLERPFSGVGRLVCRDPASGERFSTTATLVGNRSTLLAAGHFGRIQTLARSRTIAAEYCAFELRSAEGKRVFGSLVAPQPVARFSERARPDPLTPDWAILKLQDPAPASATPIVVRRIRSADLSRRPDVFMVSYHSTPEDLARTKRYSPACRPIPVRDQPLVFRHSCDTAPGSSGGLLYITTPAGPRAIGINHGSATEKDWNYGQLISRDLAGNLPRESLDAAP